MEKIKKTYSWEMPMCGCGHDKVHSTIADGKMIIHCPSCGRTLTSSTHSPYYEEHVIQNGMVYRWKQGESDAVKEEIQQTSSEDAQTVLPELSGGSNPTPQV